MKRFLLSISFVAATFVGFAEARDLNAAIPVDRELRKGVLPNSLTYYIRHNAKPAGQADFYIYSDVGAIQEADDQQGLAHFLEHMAFNGTRNLPDKELIDYLESVGVKFGANLNASTSWDCTTYLMRDVPTVRDAVVDSALLILHDWAGFIEPKDAEIDKERGVIKEELRTRDGAGWRSSMALIGALGRGTMYEHRNIIGYLEGLESFEPESLVRFYHEWYRPDYQAIVIVGDIDVDRVEARIKSLFGDLPAAAEGAPTKGVIRVPDNDEPIVEIFSDPEMQYSAVQYFIKRDAPERAERATWGAARKDIMDSMIALMQGARFDEVSMTEDAPILGGSAWFGGVGVIPTLEVTSYSAQSNDGELEEALRECVVQMERVQRYGFQSGELERARRGMMRGAESAYLNRGDRLNNSFVQRYISNYQSGDAIPSAEDEWMVDSLLISGVTLQDINARVKELFTDKNHVVMLTSPRKEGVELPTAERVLSIIDEVEGSQIEPYEDKRVGDSLLPEGVELQGSEIMETETNEEFGTTEWMLSNGVRVIVKPTDLKSDEVLFSGYTYGGNSQLGDDDYFSGALLSSLASYSGLGDYSAVDLNRQLTGHLVSLNRWVSDYSHGFNGGSSPSDVETLLQLLYLHFAAPRFEQQDFEIFRRQLRANIENQESNPDYAANSRFAEVAFGGNIRKRPLMVSDVDALELERFKSADTRLFSDADNFTFLIVGSVDLESLKPLVERYLGSLPTVAGDAKMNYIDHNIRQAKGRVRDDFSVDMEQPKVRVITSMSDKGVDYTLRNRVVGAFFEDAFDDLLLKSVREELGGTYGVSVNFSIKEIPYEHYTLSFVYDTNEEQYDHLQSTIVEQLERLSREGASQQQLAKSREFMIKNFGNTKERNSGWVSYIKHFDLTGESYIADYESVVNSVTSDDIRRVARKILRNKSRVEVIMHPKR